jgi:hypothetical protein
MLLKAYTEISESTQEVHINREDYRHVLPLKLPQRPCKHVVNLVLFKLKHTVLQSPEELCNDRDLPQQPKPTR